MFIAAFVVVVSFREIRANKKDKKFRSVCFSILGLYLCVKIPAVLVKGLVPPEVDKGIETVMAVGLAAGLVKQILTIKADLSKAPSGVMSGGKTATNKNRSGAAVQRLLQFCLGVIFSLVVYLGSTAIQQEIAVKPSVVFFVFDNLRDVGVNGSSSMIIFLLWPKLRSLFSANKNTAKVGPERSARASNNKKGERPRKSKFSGRNKRPKPKEVADA